MSEVIHGSDVVIQMFVEDADVDILCGTDMSFTRTPEFLETTSPSSGLFKDFKIRREEWSATVTGLTKIANDTALSFFYMLQTSVRRLKQLIKIVFTDPDGNIKMITGYMLIGNSSITGPASDFSQCTLELKGTGAFNISDVDPPDPADFDVLSDYWDTVDGQSYISGPSTGQFTGTPFTIEDDDTILDVDVEGTGYNVVTSVPTPGERECRWNATTNRLEFPADLIFDGNQRVFVEIKRPV